MGLGWVIGKMDYHEYVKARKSNSNNVAEYMALIRLLETIAAVPRPGDLRISGDSQLVILQIVGEWSVGAKHIIPLHAKAAGLIENLTAAGWTVSLRWVDRSENTRADAASSAALVENGVEIAQYHPAPGYTSRFREMAEALGISSIAFGKAVNALGLRGADKMPTAKALKDGYAQKRFNGFETAVDWQEEKTRAAVAAFLADRSNAAAFAFRPTKPKSDPVVAQHLCGHETTVGRRPSRKVLAEVAQSLCEDCGVGGRVRFAAERTQVLALCSTGDTLADAVESVVADRRLRPGVFLACWGKWSHAQREKALDRYRGACEKPGLHPDFLAFCASLDQLKKTELDRLIRAARSS
ncbi:MAG: reverse transcriptase-like protein [Terracidiphilus sp.]